MKSAQENRQQLARWHSDVSRHASVIFTIGAFVYTVVGAPLIPMIMPEPAATAYGIVNGVCCVLSFFGVVYYLKTRRSMVLWAQVTLAVTGAGVALSTHSILSVLPDATSNWRYISTCLGMTAVFGALWPVHNKRWILAVIYFTGCAFYGLSPIGLDGHSLSVTFTAAAFVVSAKLALLAFLDLIASQEMRIERLAKEGERLRIEQEMTVARKIQDSFSDEETELTNGRTRIKWFQTRHGVVGGDWVTTRILSDGRTVAMVVDAAGKGLQAALVVHAVQSLWADALSWEEFEPRKWIRRVNSTLISLGRKAPHSVTLGMVVIGEDRLDYWSAGHVPLYCVMKLGGQATARRVFGHGSMLGITAEYDLVPESIHLGQSEVDVILCSDGLNPGGGILRKRQIESLVDEVNTRGFVALRAAPSDDDRSVVWIKAA
jgi:hypothetical protein